MYSRSISQFTSTLSAFQFSANARSADDSNEHTISFRMSALPSRNSSTRSKSAELLEIMVGGLQLVGFVTMYVVGSMFELAFQENSPSAACDSDVNEVSRISDSMNSPSSVEPPVTSESSDSPKPLDLSDSASLASESATPFVRPGRSRRVRSLSCSNTSPAKPDPVVKARTGRMRSLSCSDISPALLNAEIGPRHHVHALLCDAWDENKELRRKLNATRDSLEVAHAQIDEIIDERNDMADTARTYIDQITTERDALIILNAFDNDLLADQASSSSCSSEWTDDVDMSLSSDSDFDLPVFDDSQNADTISAFLRSLPARDLSS